MFQPTTKFIPAIDLENQSVEIPDSGGARKSTHDLTDSLYEDAKTLLEAMHRGRSLSGDGPCLGWRTDEKYSWISYSEVIERAKNFASGLIAMGINPGQSTFIGIYMQNSIEGTLTEYACYHQSIICVPLYDTLGKEARCFILNQTELTTIVCGKEAQVMSILQEKERILHLKNIIMVNSVSKSTEQMAHDKGIQLYYFKDIECKGKENPAPIKASKPTDVATICYTSGTSGQPKGVILTHRNIIVAACAILWHLDSINLNPSDKILSYLPLAHIYERLLEVMMYLVGASVGYFSGDVKRLLDDMKVLKPTIEPMVPRILNKIYDSVQTQIKESKIKSFLMDVAVKRKISDLQRFVIRNDSIWDKFIFKNIQEKMGGKVRLMICASAPIAEEVLTFFRCAMGCPIIEAYGLTECSGPASGTVVGDYTTGHIGVPFACCHIKLIDVPELDYYTKDGKGEICIKGSGVFQGYYKDPDKTAEILHPDGWLHSGDIGMWLPNGTLKIIDRRKNIFKLSQGEYVVPDKIENIYACSAFVTQVFVYGESLKSYLVAVVVPNKEVVMSWCKEKNIKGEWKEICQHKEVKDVILEDMLLIGKKGGLNSFEQVKDIYLHPEEMTVERNLLTPTFKIKREVCRKFFKEALDAMYKHLK